MSEHFQTVESAAGYMARHDDHARRLNRASAPTLRSLLAIEHSNHRITVITGGACARDEMAAEILALRWPYIAEARQVVAELDAQGPS
jgi:hypothetical protein